MDGLKLEQLGSKQGIATFNNKKLVTELLSAALVTKVKLKEGDNVAK